MKELSIGSATHGGNESTDDYHEGHDHGNGGVPVARPSLSLGVLAEMQPADEDEVDNGVPPTPKIPSASSAQDWTSKRPDILGISEDGESAEEAAQHMEKYALDHAPPPIKLRREGETSEDPCPSPPPSPKRMKELSRKDAIHGLPFSKVFSQGSI